MLISWKTLEENKKQISTFSLNYIKLFKPLISTFKRLLLVLIHEALKPLCHCVHARIDGRKVLHLAIVVAP